MGGSISQPVKRIIYVVPERYIGLPLSQKYDIARLIGKLNKLIPDRENMQTMLLGPGRWGTTTPSLGVPVRFSEINNISIMGEIAYTASNLMPELSYGTHFFQDLVETDIFYVALFPETDNVIFNNNLLDSFPEISDRLLPAHDKYRDVVRVFDVSENHLRIIGDIQSQKLVCFIDR